MNLESAIGVVYCLIALIHLAAIGVIRHVRKRFHDPEEVAVFAFAWPIVDALWLARQWRS